MDDHQCLYWCGSRKFQELEYTFSPLIALSILIYHSPLATHRHQKALLL